MRMSLLTMLCLLAAPALAQGGGDAEAKKVAETYLNALTGQGDEAGKDLLLGGITTNAQLFTLDNWTFKSEDPVRKEEGDLAHAVQMMYDLDKAGRATLSKLLGATANSNDDIEMHEVSQADAAKLLGPTKDRVKAFSKSHKELAYALRVDKDVYWHPKNPMRAVMAKAGNKGRYSIELHRWKIMSKEGPAKTPREWSLKVVRFKSDKIDTGWKVIPASDWNAE